MRPSRGTTRRLTPSSTRLSPSYQTVASFLGPSGLDLQDGSEHTEDVLVPSEEEDGRGSAEGRSSTRVRRLEVLRF